jgi:hypothetical protein
MTDLYAEIVNYESYVDSSLSPYINKSMTKSTKEEFTEKLIVNSQLRDDFLQEFVDEIIDSMDTKDIFRAYAQYILNDLYHQCDLNQEEQIITECAETFPHVLERFGVDVPKS